MYVSHPLVRENTIESRLYQEVIVGNASRGNTLVVAPTALGKTVIAILLAAHRLEKFPESKVLMISTTRPLVSQHASSFRKFLKLDGDEVCVFTGHAAPEKRKELWERSKVVCATPQVIENDLISARYSLADVSLLVFDEAHRGTGDYPYAFIAQRYVKESTQPLILGLTASPGGDETRIAEVCESLFIENIEVRTESDPDVKPYIKGTQVEWVKVDLPEAFEKIKGSLEEALKERLETLKKLGFLSSPSPSISKKELLHLREKLQRSLAEGGNPETFIGISSVAACINLAHALELLETQGLETLRRYFRRLRKGTSKAVKSLLRDVKVLRAMRLTEGLAGEMHHPKLEKLVELIKKEPLDKRIMVFTQYRDSAQKIVERLGELPGRRVVRFVGQAMKEEDRGLTQREQLAILEKFRSGEYNVLVATSVAEEGLDIPKVDLVVFYEPIPSEIRSIQRRGRTGRSRAGRVVVLITRKTRDEGFYWSSFHKERRMREVLQRLRQKYYKSSFEKQKQLMDFYEAEHRIIVDSRELASRVARELLEYGIVSRPKVLEVGDYVLSDRVGVERKTAEDFLQSIMDKRLLEQALRLRQSFPKPVMIIEGEGLYSKRGVHPNAVRGALASIAVDFGIPVLFSRDEKDTAALLAAILRREKGEGREARIRGDKRVLTLREQQESIIAGLPRVNITLARRLLKEFKSVEGVFNASEEELTRVQGIGGKIAREIRHVITARYGAEEGAGKTL